MSNLCGICGLPETKPFTDYTSPLCEGHTPKTPQQARDDFLKHLHETLSPEELNAVFRFADKLLELVTQPLVLNAFVLVNAELAALHAEGNLSAPEIARVGIPRGVGEGQFGME